MLLNFKLIIVKLITFSFYFEEWHSVQCNLLCSFARGSVEWSGVAWRSEVVWPHYSQQRRLCLPRRYTTCTPNSLSPGYVQTSPITSIPPQHREWSPPTSTWPGCQPSASRRSRRTDVGSLSTAPSWSCVGGWSAAVSVDKLGSTSSLVVSCLPMYATLSKRHRLVLHQQLLLPLVPPLSPHRRRWLPLRPR